jgi:hypothetical protein
MPGVLPGRLPALPVYRLIKTSACSGVSSTWWRHLGDGIHNRRMRDPPPGRVFEIAVAVILHSGDVAPAHSVVTGLTRWGLPPQCPRTLSCQAFCCSGVSLLLVMVLVSDN